MNVQGQHFNHDGLSQAKKRGHVLPGTVSPELLHPGLASPPRSPFREEIQRRNSGLTIDDQILPPPRPPSSARYLPSPPQQDGVSVPVPPGSHVPRPPSGRPRPRSSKGRPRPVSHSGGRSASGGVTVYSPDERQTLSADGITANSFSRFRRLPAIGKKPDSTKDIQTADKEEDVPSKDVEKHKPHQHLSKTVSFESHSSDSDQLMDILTDETVQMSFRQRRYLPPEPEESEKDKIHLAVKILDGTRHSRWFRPTDNFETILAFAESITNEPLPYSCHICTTEVPRHVFMDMSQTFEQAGLQSKTLLYIEELDS